MGSQSGGDISGYGMEVEWQTIEALARTKAVDLWILLPLGQAINRLLTREGPPEKQWADRLTRCFGTEEWKEVFYRKESQPTLFGAEERLAKEANFEAIGDFFVRRLSAIFEKVAENPLPLRNSKNIPIYLLCFAAANPRGAPTAVKIASHILGR
jgi:three-Cys-motif partner protein